jgi:hypothetical protein
LSRSVNGGFEQQLQAVFTQVPTEAANLCGVTRQTVLVVVHAAEELPQDVLAPAHHQVFVTEVEAVFEVQQADHQANGQLRTSGVRATGTHKGRGGAKQTLVFKDLTAAILVLELCRYGLLDLAPWQAGCQHRQWIVQIDHGVDSAAEKVYWLHLQISQKVALALTLFEGFGAHDGLVDVAGELVP